MIGSLFKRKARAQRAHPASLPDGMRVYAVGDIHGRLDLLENLHARILKDAARNSGYENAIIYLGDYIDRGPQSASVLATLAAEPLGGWPRIMLRGNHEDMLLEFLKDPSCGAIWRRLGGLETLLSYRVEVSELLRGGGDAAIAQRLGEVLPKEHLALLQATQYHHVIGDYLFCHAGIRPGIPLHAQTSHDLTTIRDEFLRSTADHGLVVVHGHSPVEQPERLANRISIDTGAYATNRLTCLVLEMDRHRFIIT